MNDKAILLLYNDLKDTYDVGSIDDFKNYLMDNNKRQMFFDEVIKPTYDVDNIETFNKVYGLKKKEDSTLVAPKENVELVTEDTSLDTQETPETTEYQPQNFLDPIESEDVEFEDSLKTSISPDYTLGNFKSENEEFLVPEMQYKFGKYGFDFKEANILGDAMRVKVRGTNKELYVKLDQGWNQRDGGEKLKKFLKENKQTESDVQKQSQAIVQNQRTIQNEEEYNSTIKLFNQQSRRYKFEVDEYAKTKAKLKGIYDSNFSNVSKEDIRNNPVLKANYEEWLKNFKQLEATLKNLESQGKDFKYKGAKLDNVAGDYLAMKSKQGSWWSGFFNENIGGLGPTFVPTGAVIDLATYLDEKMTMADDTDASAIVKTRREEYKKDIIKIAKEKGLAPEGLNEDMSLDKVVKALGGDTNDVKLFFDSVVTKGFLNTPNMARARAMNTGSTEGGIKEIKKTKFDIVQDALLDIERKAQKYYEPQVDPSDPKGKRLISARDRAFTDALSDDPKFRNPFSMNAAQKDNFGNEGMVSAGRKAFNYLKDKSTTEQWAEVQKQGNFLKKGFLGLGGSLPAMLGTSTPLGWAQRTAQMYNMSTDFVDQEMEKNPMFDKISEAEKTKVKMPIGIATAVLENIGLRNIISQKGLLNSLVSKALRKSNKNTTAKTFQQFIREDIESMIGRGSLVVLGGGLAEFETGLAQEIAQITVKDVYNARKQSEMFETPETFAAYMEQVVDAGLAEMVGGFVMGSIPATTTAINGLDVQSLDPNIFEVFEKTIQEPTLKSVYIAKLKNKIADPSSELDAKEAQKELDLVNKLEGIMIANRIPFDEFNTNQRKEALQLLLQKETLENEIKEADKVLSKPKQNLLDKVNKRLEELTEEGIATQEENETEAEGITQFNSTLDEFKNLEQDEQLKFLDQAGKELLEEAESRGETEIQITEQQNLERAVELFNKDQQTETDTEVEVTTEAEGDVDDEVVYEMNKTNKKTWSKDFEILDNRQGQEQALFDEEGNKTSDKWWVVNKVTGQIIEVGTKTMAEDVIANAPAYAETFGDGTKVEANMIITSAPATKAEVKAEPEAEGGNQMTPKEIIQERFESIKARNEAERKGDNAEVERQIKRTEYLDSLLDSKTKDRLAIQSDLYSKNAVIKKIEKLKKDSFFDFGFVKEQIKILEEVLEEYNKIEVLENEKQFELNNRKKPENIKVKDETSLNVVQKIEQRIKTIANISGQKKILNRLNIFKNSPLPENYKNLLDADLELVNSSIVKIKDIMNMSFKEFSDYTNNLNTNSSLVDTTAIDNQIEEVKQKIENYKKFDKISVDPAPKAEVEANGLVETELEKYEKGLKGLSSIVLKSLENSIISGINKRKKELKKLREKTLPNYKGKSTEQDIDNFTVASNILFDLENKLDLVKKALFKKALENITQKPTNTKTEAASSTEQDSKAKAEVKTEEDISQDEQTDIEEFFKDEVDENVQPVSPNLSLNKKGKQPSKQNKNKTRIIKIAKASARAIAKLLPKTKIVLHESQEEYTKYTGLKNRGYYDTKSDIIHINLTNASLSTVPHEVFHAVFLSKVKTDPRARAMAIKMVESIKKTLPKNSKLYKEIDAFSKLYTGDQEQFQEEEFIAELIGLMSSQEFKNYKQLKAPAKYAIVEFLKKIAKKFGIKLGSDFGKDDQSVIDLINVLATKTITGEEITEQDVEILQVEEQGDSGQVGTFTLEGRESKAPDISTDTRTYAKNIIQKDLTSYKGQNFVTNMYDFTNAGPTDIGAGIVLDLYGGKNYVADMMEKIGAKLGEVSNLAAFNSKENAEGFIKNAIDGDANLFAPHVGTKEGSWQFQQNIFAELTEKLLDNNIITNKELIESFNSGLTSKDGKSALKTFTEAYSKAQSKEGSNLPKLKNTNNLNDFIENPKKLIELLDIDNNYSPDLRKILNDKIAANDKVKNALGVKNKIQFAEKLEDPMNVGSKAFDLIGIIEFDNTTFEAPSKPKKGDADYHPSFAWTVRAKIKAIVQPTTFYQSTDATDSYTKFNKNEVVVSTKTDVKDSKGNSLEKLYKIALKDTRKYRTNKQGKKVIASGKAPFSGTFEDFQKSKFKSSNVSSSAGSGPKVATVKSEIREDTPQSRKQKVYRAGDLTNKAEPIFRFDTRRSTGHFGTGFYFFSKQKDAQDYAKRTGTKTSSRIVTSLNLDDYNLATGSLELHEELKDINNDYSNLTFLKKSKNNISGYRIEKVANILGINISDSLLEEYSNSVTKKLRNFSNKESASTLIMKALGFEGVNSTGTELDNGTYGTVIYDIKKPQSREQQDAPQSRKQKSVSELESNLEGKYNVTLDLYQNKDFLELDKIIVTEDQQNTGVGSNVMREVIDFANKQGLTIALTPSTSYGATSIDRLKGFYKGLGFVENKGINKDFTTKQSMLKLPEVKGREQKSIEEIINDGRQNNFRESAIRDFLVRVLKKPAKEVDKLMSLDKEFLEVVPKSFTNIKGGIKAGTKLYKRVEAFRKKLVKKNDKLKGNKKLTSTQIVDKTIDYLQKQPEYINEGDKYTVGNKKKGTQETRTRKGFSTQQARMLADYTKTAGVRPTNDMNSKIRNAKAAITQKIKGARDLQKQKTILRNFIRQSLPKELYTKSEVVRLINTINDVKKDNIENLMQEVIDFVNEINVKSLQAQIKSILNNKYQKVESGRVKPIKISDDIRKRIAFIKSNMLSSKATPEEISTALIELNKRFNELAAEIEQTEEMRSEMVDISLAMKYINTLQLENKNEKKVEELDTIVNTLEQMIEFGRSELKDQILQKHLYYLKQFELGYESITGKKIDMSNPEALDELNKMLKTFRNEAKKRKSQNVIKIFFRSLKEGVSRKVFGTAEEMFTLMDRLDKLPGEMYGGNLQELYTERVDAATRLFKGRIMLVEQLIQDHLEKLYGKNWKKRSKQNRIAKDLGIMIQEGVPLPEISQNKIAYLYNMYKDPANRKSFANPEMYGIKTPSKTATTAEKEAIQSLNEENAERVMNEMIAQLDSKVKETADWQVSELYPFLYNHYNDAYKKLYRTDLPWNEFYSGTIYREGIDPEDVSMLDMLNPGNMYNTAVGAPSTKVRENSNKPIKDMDMMDVLNTYLNQMEYFASYGEVVNDMSKFFNNKYVSDAIKTIHGEDIYRFTLAMIDKISSRGTSSSSGNSFINAMNNVFILSRLAFSPVIMIKQLTSFITYANDIGPLNYLKYAAKNKAEMMKVYKEIRENSIYMKDRQRTSIMRAIETYSDSNMKEFVPNGTKDWIVNFAMWTTKFGDKAAIYLGGMPNYSYYKSQFKKKNPQATEQEAIDYAVIKFERDTKRTQQSGDLQDKDYFQTKDPIYRGLNMFLTTPKQYLRKEIFAIRNLNRKLSAWDRNAGKGTISQNLRTFVMFHVFMPVFFQYVSMGLPGILRDPRDDDDKDLLRAAMIGNLNSLFIIGELFNLAGDLFTNKPWAGNTFKSIGILSIAGSLAKKFAYTEKLKDPVKKAEAYKKFYLELATVSGIPAPTIAKFVENYGNIGKDGDIGKDILRLMNFSKYQIEGPGKGGRPKKIKTIQELNEEYDKNKAKEQRDNSKRIGSGGFGSGGFGSGGFGSGGFGVN